jgi:very-short-patch-repair endonuclease
MERAPGANHELSHFAPHRARQKADFQRDAPMHMGGLELLRVEP